MRSEDRPFLPPFWMVYPVAAAWLSPDPVQIGDPVEEITTELQNVVDPNKLGAYYCYNPDRKKADWTRHPELIAREMNISNMFYFYVTAVDVVKAQKKLGIWEKRKNREQWEFTVT